jgi:hypothetical protein
LREGNEEKHLQLKVSHAVQTTTQCVQAAKTHYEYYSTLTSVVEIRSRFTTRELPGWASTSQLDGIGCSQSASHHTTMSRVTCHMSLFSSVLMSSTNIMSHIS